VYNHARISREKKTRTIQLRAECGDDRPCDATLYWAMYSD
jgi:hypothetical protein